MSAQGSDLFRRLVRERQATWRDRANCATLKDIPIDKLPDVLDIEVDGQTIEVKPSQEWTDFTPPTRTKVIARLYFPRTGESTKPARAICALCESRDACLDFALETNQANGLWGGMTNRNRTSEKKRRQRIARQKGKAR